MRRFLFWSLCFCLLFPVGLSSCDGSDSAAVIFGGTTGKLTWTLTEDGVLTITGEGPMPDYRDGGTSETPPWYPHVNRISSLTIGEGVTRIGDYAFMLCSFVTEVVIPESVTSMGDWAFNYCTGLQEAYIGDGVTEIAAKAFAECTALKTVVIGKSIQRIGDQAFNTRSSWDQMTLEKITVLFDDIASGSFPVLESGSRGVFPKPGGWDLVSYKIYVPKGTKAEYQKNWSDYSSLIVEMQ
ncbi:leucine-rich repeat domain-containing protein [Alistipes putredinis]|uniref:leucine-rich repeat domain-containing protein n=1 Tax=Alistipes putredinis TaxID=28117 RepID=UPI003AB2843B